MGTYIVGDIHGCFNKWIELKENIEREDENAKFILVGDIIDRGSETLEMIQWAMENITSDGKYQMVLGNHEYMKIELWESYKELKTQGVKGKTFRDYIYDRYGTLEYLDKKGLTEDEIESIIEWFKTLPVYKELDIETLGIKTHYIIVHSYIPHECLDKEGKFIPEMLEKQDTEMYGIDDYKQRIVWDRNFYGNIWKYNTIVVHGHTPTLVRDLTIRGAMPGKIHFLFNDINIDCGVVFDDNENANLAAIRLEDFEEFYLKTTETKIKNRGKEYIIKEIRKAGNKK